jgi:hypothetical protein
MDRPDYRVIIDLKEVAEGDVTSLAQQIWDREAESFDANLGDFEMRILKVSPEGAQFDTNWEPHGG